MNIDTLSIFSSCFVVFWKINRNLKYKILVIYLVSFKVNWKLWSNSEINKLKKGHLAFENVYLMLLFKRIFSTNKSFENKKINIFLLSPSVIILKKNLINFFKYLSSFELLYNFSIKITIITNNYWCVLSSIFFSYLLNIRLRSFINIKKNQNAQ